MNQKNYLTKQSDGSFVSDYGDRLTVDGHIITIEGTDNSIDLPINGELPIADGDGHPPVTGKPVQPIIPEGGHKPVIKPEQPTLPTPENPIEDVKPEIENPTPDAGDIIADINGGIDAVGQTVDQNAQKIDELEQSFMNFANEVNERFDEMDARIDGTNASLHAVTNARPMVANGQTAFGVGTGFAGSAQAVAVGVAHSFEDTGWSASATVNATTGSYSEVNGGAGLQYAW